MKLCSECGKPFHAGDIVALMVYAEWRDLKSKVVYAIDKPFDADPASLRHRECPANEEI